jgi:NADH-quinone oxidoreductase subunit L
LFFLDNAWLTWALPASSFVLILLFGRRLVGKGAELGIAAVAGSFVISCGAIAQWIGRAATGEGEEKVRQAVDHTLFTWYSNGSVRVPFAFHVDGLTVMMLFVVTLVSLLVQVYSTAYMHEDRRYTYYYAALSLFSASMLILVTASTTLLLLLGWEGVGLCSFMLIGHWWEERDNSDAALKAFFTTRLGDAGMLIGIIILFFANGQSFDIARLNRAALSGGIDHTVLVVGAVALFMGVIGKSAQFPLHTWLPDAMAGPTPVSALIHAATMVVAGVYLVARCYGVFWAAFRIGHHPAWHGVSYVAVIGAITIVIAALLAFVQDDIKKVLAYSTVSQLGYMVMALGVGAWTGGIFHLFTHAFFKACLFLGAGSVSHSGSHHSFDMKKDMGGLWRAMPITHATFVIASLALAGIFPLAGFWSKDEILLTAGKNGYNAFMVVGLAGAFMTAAYMARCVYLTFYGEHRGGHGAPAHAPAVAAAPAVHGTAGAHPATASAGDHQPDHGADAPHESPVAITAPLVILAAFSVVAGWINGFGLHWFGEWTRNEVVVQAHVPEYRFSVPMAALSLAVAAAGIAVGLLYYWRHAFAPLHGATERSSLARAGYRFVRNKYYLDVLYTDIVVGSIKGVIARGAYWINQRVIDGAVNAVAIGARAVARFTYEVIDQKVVDGLVNGTGASAEEGGSILRRLQTGRVQQYAAFLFGAGAVGALALLLYANQGAR